MARWADLLIRRVRKNSTGVVTDLEVSIDLVKGISKGRVEMTREDVILLIKDGVKIVTITYSNEDAIIGAPLKVIEVNGKEYLRTDSNKTTIDNLDNLDLF